MSDQVYKPSIHLWIYNHPINGISDQIDFFLSLLKQHHYPVSLGKKPKPEALNVVIENFSASNTEPLIQFCQKYQKRVAVIMTEHLDFNLEKNQLEIHGEPLWTQNDYMNPHTQIARIRYLIECSPYINQFFVLGDLPKLNHISHVFQGIPVRTLPFPKIDPIVPMENTTPLNTLLFTGVTTHYRKGILQQIQQHHTQVMSPSTLVSKKRRQTLMVSSKIILNIPQRKNWPWLSPMRIIAALKAGRATVSLGTQDTSEISSCCFQIPYPCEKAMSHLSEAITNWESLYQTAYKKYHEMAGLFEKKYVFPHDAFNVWHMLDAGPEQGRC